MREDENGSLWLNDSIFKRGKLKNKTAVEYQQFYFNGVRALYKSANGKNHNHLGYLFQLIPLINREWNVLCKNPLETELDAVKTAELQVIESNSVKFIMIWKCQLGIYRFVMIVF